MKLMTAAVFKYGSVPFLQSQSDRSGDRGIRTDGMPSKPCKRVGMGKIPAPVMESACVSMMITGKIDTPRLLHLRNRPTINARLKIPVSTSPTAKMNRVSVPRAPNSLTSRTR